MRAECWLCWLVLVVALPTRAEPRRPSLHWTRGAGASTCIDPLTLTERVEALTGPVFLPPHDHALEGHIEAEPGGYALRLTVTGTAREPHGERILHHAGANCRDFDDAILFLIALTIEPDLELERLTRNPGLEGRTPGEELLRELEASPPQPAFVEPSPPPPLPLPPAPTPYRWEGSLGLAVGSDVLRGAALGPIVSSSFPVARWLQLSAQVRVFVRASPHPIDDAHSLRVQSFSLAPLLCVRRPSEPLGVQACLGPEPSLVRARGVGFQPSERGNLVVWGALAKLELGYRVHDRWSVSVQGFLRVGSQDKRFVYQSELVGMTQEAARLARWGVGAALTAAYRFGSGKSAAAGTDLRNSEVTP